MEEIKDEIIGLLTEGVFNSRMDLIVTYHEVGRLLFENDLLTHMTKEYPRHRRTFYRCVQFIKQIPNLEMLPDGKNISWTKVLKLLPKETREKPSLEDKIKQFIEDMFPQDRRKEFIKEIILEWKVWK